jgi:hypothetical protein
MTDTFDYYLAWLACPLSIVGILFMFYAFTQQSNKAAKYIGLVICFVYALIFIKTLLIILKYNI